MNGLERVQRRLCGEDVDRAPNFDIYMTRAAHYVGRPLSEYYLDYRALVEANLAVRRFEVVEPTLHKIFVDRVGDEAAVDSVEEAANG